MQSNVVAITDDVTIGENGSKTTRLLANDINHTGGTLTVTYINGIAVSAGAA